MTTRILIVDDETDVEPLFRQGLRRELKAGSIELEFAEGGAHALRLIASDDEPPFDTVISDLNMPGMGGLEFLERAIGLQPDMVCAVVSANADIGTRVTASNIGATQFFAKPIDFRALRTFVRNPPRTEPPS